LKTKSNGTDSESKSDTYSDSYSHPEGKTEGFSHTEVPSNIGGATHSAASPHIAADT
jgi:hypothetical protein